MPTYETFRPEEAVDEPNCLLSELGKVDAKTAEFRAYVREKAGEQILQLEDLADRAHKDWKSLLELRCLKTLIDIALKDLDPAKRLAAYYKKIDALRFRLYKWGIRQPKAQDRLKWENMECQALLMALDLQAILNPRKKPALLAKGVKPQGLVGEIAHAMQPKVEAKAEPPKPKRDYSKMTDEEIAAAMKDGR